jgi:activator-of-BECN1-regulated-autophagy protein 1
MASTHGDHTIKITDCSSGVLLQTLEGHPRTPWTVKFHPTNPHVVASGCLGHQVRIWNWQTKQCLQMIRLEFAIISLSFHPTGHVLAIANGTRLHFLSLTNNRNLETLTNPDVSLSREQTQHKQQQQQQQLLQQQRGFLTEVEQRHMLRCVHFPPNGNTIIVGGVNPNGAGSGNGHRRGGISGGGMSFYLRLWDFDLQAAVRPNDPNNSIFGASRTASGGMRRRAISNVRNNPSLCHFVCMYLCFCVFVCVCFLLVD